MTPSVYVDPGHELALDRPSLAAPAPQTRERLLAYCEQWAAEVGWTLASSAVTADAAIAGPGAHAAPDAIRVVEAQGIDGFRWGIRHLAFSAQWPAEIVRYGPAADAVADVRRPQSAPRGVAVLLHGGFWMDAWRRDLMDGIAVDLAQRGFQTWNAEYRRVGSGGGWPHTADDVVAAVDAACASAHVAAVTVVGHSAGAHLALIAAHRRPEVVTRVVALAGLCDLVQAQRRGVGGRAVERFLAGAPPAPASPVEHVPLRSSVGLAHCADDRVVPIEQSRRYVDAAAAAGGAAELLTLDEGDHMSLIEPENGWGMVAPRIFS